MKIEDITQEEDTLFSCSYDGVAHEFILELPEELTAAVMLGATETTFYTVGVYLAGLKGNFGKIIFCALCTDAFSFAVAYVITSFI